MKIGNNLMQSMADECRNVWGVGTNMNG